MFGLNQPASSPSLFRMKRVLPGFIVCIAMTTAWFFAAAPHDSALPLSDKTLHLGRPGQHEWEIYRDRPVDGEKLTLTFQSQTNATEHTLCLWQKDVKLTWPVLLNGRRLGALVTAEPAQETRLVIAPGMLREGENVLEIASPNGLDDIEVGSIRILPEPLIRTLEGATVEVTVTDEATGAALPCRLTVTRPDGTLQPLLASPTADVAVRTGVVYTRAGRARLSLPPGGCVLHATRGFEWSVASTKLDLEPGARRNVSLQLTREVDTSGWVAADSHIHTLTHSGHGDATIGERMLTIAGEGIELAFATDHNHHADYAPVAASMHLDDAFTPVMGNEITTKHGHFNAFPIAPGAPVVDHVKDDWSVLIPAMRTTPGVKVITLNHPRDLHSGFVPLGGLQFSPESGRHRQEAALRDVDAMEVITSGALQSDVMLLYRDWFALLNRGHRMAAIGSSDSHDVSRFILGQGRTYVSVDDSQPGRVNLDQVWRSYRTGRLLVSLGLLATVTVDDRWTTGDLATGLGGSLKVRATVSGPSWVKADHVALYANGLLLREQKISDDGRPGEKAVVTWEIPKPKHDVHLVVIATGPGVTAPYWELPRPYQPASKAFTSRVVGSTNPVWVDADGDGRFESSYEYAQSLMERYPGPENAAALKEALKDYDETVAVQVEAMKGAEPPEAK